MSSGETTTVKSEEAAAAVGGADTAAGKKKWKCPKGDHHVHREDLKKVWKECQEESFWYRALPLSLGSMTVTGGLIYKNVWKASKSFGPFPKLAVAGILGYAVGKASYMPTCRSKFQDLGIKDGPGFGPWSEGGREGGGPWKSRHGHRSCHHVCEECKKKDEAAPAPAEKV
ncbi:OCIA domain-containing protein 2 [Notolabrus celidotus]|uniref:OCIA domain-containing protein 2 n=1 Tax=Notolabrus celidotus TaxID=1203425 RepID=UPI00148FFEB7|nr:OCIA domain-containing protein 2 [Notolabrus celidotus]